MTDLSPQFPLPRSGSRPEAMADVPGICELALTRAVVQYRSLHDVDLPEGRIEDIGLALVLEGRYAAAAQAVDLGSGKVKELDLSSELVVLDWVYAPTLDHVQGLLRAAADPSAEGRDARNDLAQYCFALALRVLRRAGYGPLSRATLLRIGFRDICRDLDLHEGTSVRLVIAQGRLARAYLDCDGNALLFRTGFQEPDAVLEDALAGAFPGRDIRRLPAGATTEGLAYQIRFPLPLTFREARGLIRELREGLGGLLARFEPLRYRALQEVLDTLGPRETLSQIHFREPPDRARAVSSPPHLGGTVVH